MVWGRDGGKRRSRRRAAIATLGWAVASSLLLAQERAPARGQPSAGEPGPIAVLPIENLGGATAPIEEIRETMRRKLEERRLTVLDDGALESFMRRHRVRYVAGLARETARDLAAETGVVFVLVTSLDLYTEIDSPRLALTCRLVSAGSEAHILWMDSADLAGDQAPGFLGLGRIEDPLEVRDRVTDRLADSLALHLRGDAERSRAETPDAGGGPRRFRPRSAFRSPEAPPADSRPLRVAVLPFSDTSGTRHAGEILALQILRSLVRAGGIDVVEPGVVREALLSARLIQEEGPSIPQADLLRSLLHVDVVMYGEVAMYTESGAGALEAEIGFSVRAIDTGRRQVIWSSVSHARGDDKVFFFGLGRVPTAHALAGLMARGLVGELWPALARAT